jgi:flagellar biosynthesis/type III secretory pathway M-ring protein FliF/YscJ
MIGSWRWNVVIGGAGGLLTFLISLSRNTLLTSFVRGLAAFAAFGVLAFAVRFLLAQAHLPANRPEAERTDEAPGAVLDLVTPDEGETLNEMLKEQWAEGRESPAAEFQPLQPKRLVNLDQPDPGDVVQAIRRLNNER